MKNLTTKQYEARLNIIELLNTSDRKNWLAAAIAHQEGGFNINDAWRWFLYAMFDTANFTSPSHCGEFYYNYWVGGDNAFFEIEFEQVKLKVVIIEIGSEETPNKEKLHSEITIIDERFEQGVINFDCYTVNEYIPKVKPYKDFEGLEGNYQAYFYAIMCRCINPYKQKIIRRLHIDTNYIDPERKQNYQNSLFPLD
jgi:hypothetical protein